MVRRANQRPRLDEVSGRETLRLVPEGGALGAGGVRSLARGMQVLVALNQSNPATVARLTELTGLPKPTLIRQLKTLCAEGFVDRDPDGEGYRVTAKVALLSQGYDRESALEQAAKPVLHDIGSDLPWPCELLQYDGESMVVRAHNRSHAPLSIRGLEVRRMPLLGSASGDAYLAWCAPDACRGLLEQHTNNDPDASAKIHKHLAGVRRRGYGVQEWTLLVQQLTVVAVPVICGQTARAALSLVALSNALGDDGYERQFLPRLREAAAAIAASLIDRAEVS